MESGNVVGLFCAYALAIIAALLAVTMPDPTAKAYAAVAAGLFGAGSLTASVNLIVEAIRK